MTGPCVAWWIHGSHLPTIFQHWSQVAQGAMRKLPNLPIFPLNSLAPGQFVWNFRYIIFDVIYWLMAEVSIAKLPWDVCHCTLLMISQHCSRQWLDAVSIPALYQSQCWPRPMSPYGITRQQQAVWYKIKFGSQNVVTKIDNHLCMATNIGSQCQFSVSTLG